MVPRAIEAADRLKAEHGIDAEVVDVRSLVPLDTQTIMGSVGAPTACLPWRRTHVCAGGAPRSCRSLPTRPFYDLDGPPVRITTPHIPLPAADALEDAVLPTVDRSPRRCGGLQSNGRMHRLPGRERGAGIPDRGFRRHTGVTE
jgi:pyruvate dehydrogenase E1 component beta subunit